jgi:hypothetical protein
MKWLINILLILALALSPAVAQATNTFSGKFVAASSQNLVINSTLGLTIGGNISIELWFKASSQPAANTVMTLYTTGMNPYATPFVRYWIGYADVAGVKTLRFNREKTCVSNNFTDDAVTLSTGTWYHIVETYDGTSVRGYLGTSGSPDVLVAGPTAQSGSGTSGCPDTYYSTIGSMISGGGINYTDGAIDEVRVWSTALSLATIQANYCSVIDSSASLVASWHLNNALTDSSGNGFTLTNNNSTTFTSVVPACFPSAAHFFPFYEF